MSPFGGPVATNDKIVDEQKAMADEAAAREAELARRREEARQQILAIFGGGTVTPQTWQETTTTEEVPSGYSIPAWVRNIPGFSGRTYKPGNPMFDAHMSAGLLTPKGTTTREVAGKELVPGESKTYTGIGDDFYDAYRQSIMDYYEPQLQENYMDAAGDLMLGFSSRGTRNSSAAINAQNKLKKDRDLQYGQLAGSADQQAGQLRNQVNDEMYSLLSLASSAEDPTVAVNQALSEVNAVQPAPQTLTPLGDVLGAAASAYGAYDAQKLRNTYASAAGYPNYSASPGLFSGSARTYG